MSFSSFACTCPLPSRGDLTPASERTLYGILKVEFASPKGGFAPVVASIPLSCRTLNTSPEDYGRAWFPGASGPNGTAAVGPFRDDNPPVFFQPPTLRSPIHPQSKGIESKCRAFKVLRLLGEGQGQRSVGLSI